MAQGQRLGVGIIGAGNISSAYLKAMQGFEVLDIKAIADMKPEVAAARAKGPDSFGLFSCSKATNEMNYAAQKFARQVMGTNNVDSCNRT